MTRGIQDLQVKGRQVPITQAREVHALVAKELNESDQSYKYVSGGIVTHRCVAKRLSSGLRGAGLQHGLGHEGEPDELRNFFQIEPRSECGFDDRKMGDLLCSQPLWLLPKLYCGNASLYISCTSMTCAICVHMADQ